ncbi:non-ribosomal peptide synthetase component E (peptide arylation enzyme) [Rhodoligotrophos appendicifer]|uniref:class I adenylate-forming enzyme family protein n=1 Tax=Rhodoligotrophos appendicifer TaxID=987056 RepID=UPI001184981F|nr:AMP-binding protein [Rhodoligotrophos appendicifer]
MIKALDMIQRESRSGTILHRYTKRDFDVNYAAGHWTPDHLLQTMATHLMDDPDHLAVVDGDRRVTRRELASLVEKSAGCFHAEGIRRGDIVAVQLPNSLHIIVVALALFRIGAIFHGINSSYRHNDVMKIFRRSQPKMYVHTPNFRSFDYGPLVESLRGDGGFGFTARLVDVDRPIDEAFAGPSSIVDDIEAPDPDDLILIGATSGSTGDPKLYMHTQNTQFNEARCLVREMGFGPADVFLAFAPITHRGVFMWGFMLSMASGAAIVIQRVYDPVAILKGIDAEKVTSLFAIPTQVVDLLNVCDRLGGGGDSLRVLMMAGAPVQPQLVERLQKSWPSCAPVTGFGTSETGYAIITRPSYPLEELQTCGRPLNGIEIRIARPLGSDDPDGEVMIRGAYISAGYYDDQQATNQAYDRDGWFNTGDLGHLDAQGNLVVTGRTKNVIIRSGLKIQAEEIEQLLLRHTDISHAVVIGLPDSQVGERTVACVILRDKRPFTLEEVNAFLQQQGTAKFKWPEKLVVMDEMPMNAAGKFDRITMRKQLNG